MNDRIRIDSETWMGAAVEILAGVLFAAYFQQLLGPILAPAIKISLPGLLGEGLLGMSHIIRPSPLPEFATCATLFLTAAGFLWRRMRNVSLGLMAAGTADALTIILVVGGAASGN
jgi:hypothetical protein